MINSREIALKIIYDTIENESYLNIAYKNAVQKYKVASLDASFIKELSYGTVSNLYTIDYNIDRFVKNRSKADKYTINILRLGVYQIFYTDKIPPSAICDEAVKLAKKLAHGTHGFVNAVLRNIVRAGELSLPNATEKNYLSVKYSFTPSMTGAFLSAYGRDFTIELMEEMNRAPAISARVNLLKTTKQELILKLKNQGISAYENEMTPCGIFLSSLGNLDAIKEYRDGLFTIQDTASQMASLILMPQKNEKVLDLCASPGGKTTHLAELMQNEGEILAFDLYEKRLASVNEASKRLGITIIKTEARDSAVIKEELINYADKVLLDAPCSGWGVIRRKPDIKYKSEKTDYKELTGVQKKLIFTASKYLKNGGELLYSTCTLNKAENDKVIDGFLAENKNFELVFKKTFFPHIDGTDGFFIAKLKKSGEEK